MKYVLTIVFLFTLSTQITSRSVRPPQKACPDFTQTADFSDPVILRQEQDKLLYHLWSTPEPTLTRRIINIRNLLFKMAYSGNEQWRTLAFLASQWFWVVAPIIESNLNLCPLAKIIDATVDFANDKDCSKLIEALNNCGQPMGESASLALDNGIKNVGCGQYTQSPVPSKPDCPGDGFQYKLKELWDLEGYKYPRRLRLLVEDLSRSNDKLDKLFQLMITVNISPHFAALVTEFSYALKYQLFYMMTADTPLPENCCENFVNQTKDLMGKIKDEAGKTLQLAIKNAGC